MADRVRGMRATVRLFAVLIGVALTGSIVVAQDSVPATERPINFLCERAFVQARNDVLAVAAGAVDAEPTAGSDAASSPSPSAMPTPASLAFVDPAFLDAAVRACSSLEDFQAGAARFPELAGAVDILSFLGGRCEDPATGLAEYATCVSLVRALATPAPTPEPTPEPLPTPKPGAEARAKKSKVPRVRAGVPGATRVQYFNVRGTSPSELLRDMKRQARKVCGQRGPIACVTSRPNFRPRVVQDPATGSCRVTGVQRNLVTVAHIPRWTAPRRVPAYMAWWWKKLAKRIAWHEAQHVKIAKKHVNRFPRMVVGQPCSAIGPQVQRWSAAHQRAQNAFDRLDYPRTDRASARWLSEAYERFLR